VYCIVMRAQSDTSTRVFTGCCIPQTTSPARKQPPSPDDVTESADARVAGSDSDVR
jgi:hypothetical protein